MAESKVKSDKSEAKADPAVDGGTPSGAALLKVGVPNEDASDEEKNAHAAEYAAVKRKHRWG